MTKTKTTFLALVTVLLAPIMATAAPIIWAVDGVFDDGSTISGTFTVESTSGDMLDWALSVTAGVFDAYTYDPVTSAFFGFDYWGNNPYSFLFLGPDGQGNSGAYRFVNLSFTDTFYVPGTIIADVTGYLAGSWECGVDCISNRFLVSGSATSVPEPGTLALLGLGLAGIAARRRRKS